MKPRTPLLTGNKQRATRTALICVVAMTAISQTGCQIFDRFRNRQIVAPVAFEAVPTKEQILNHVAQQTANVRQLQTDVRVSVDGLPTLRGTLAVEKPDRMRLKAGLLGVSEMGIDVGSNSDRFWIWSKATQRGMQPAIFFARHSDYQNSEIRQMIPLEPMWLIDALGLVTFSPTDRHEGPFRRKDGRYEIHTYHRRPTGTVTRVSAIDPQFGWINQQAFYDSNGRRIGYVDSIKHEFYPELNVSLPKRIELHFFQPDGTSMRLAVDASAYKLNSMYGDPEKLWSMPNPSDVQIVDLAGAPVQAAAVEPDRAQAPQARRYDHHSSEWYRGPAQPTAPHLR